MADGSDPKLSVLFVAKWVLLIIFDPLWFFVRAHVQYTNLYFFVSNFTFWHLYIINICVGPFLFLWKDEGKVSGIWSLLFVLPAIALFKSMSVWGKNENTARIQKIEHLQYGLLGMSFATLTLIVCLFAHDLDFNRTIIRSIVLVITPTLMYSYFQFSNICTRLYIRLPHQQMPFSSFSKSYVWISAFFHILLAYLAVQVTTVWPMSLLLIVASFTFTVDTYSLLTSPSFLICEHRRWKENLRKEPIDGVICHVAVRRIHEKLKFPNEQLPADFQFDDEIELDPIWYQETFPGDAPRDLV